MGFLLPYSWVTGVSSLPLLSAQMLLEFCDSNYQVLSLLLSFVCFCKEALVSVSYKETIWLSHLTFNYMLKALIFSVPLQSVNTVQE